VRKSRWQRQCFSQQRARVASRGKLQLFLVASPDLITRAEALQLAGMPRLSLGLREYIVVFSVATPSTNIGRGQYNSFSRLARYWRRPQQCATYSEDPPLPFHLVLWSPGVPVSIEGPSTQYTMSDKNWSTLRQRLKAEKDTKQVDIDGEDR